MAYRRVLIVTVISRLASISCKANDRVKQKLNLMTIRERNEISIEDLKTCLID